MRRKEGERRDGGSGIATQVLECPSSLNPTLMLCSSKPHIALNLKSFEVDQQRTATHPLTAHPTDQYWTLYCTL